MGLDFSALIQSTGSIDAVAEEIAFLEAGGTYPEVRAALAHGLSRGFGFAEYPGGDDGVAVWRAFDDWEQPLPGRPRLPDLGVELDLPSGCSLTFGPDAIWLHHPLRWIFFVTDDDWRRGMLDAVRGYCRAFGATDCIVAHDEHPAVVAFRAGLPYREALRVAAAQGEGEVSSLDELYIEAGHDDELVFGGPNGEEYAIPLWETHGYWKLNLASG